jgi:HEAT repeat protein
MRTAAALLLLGLATFASPDALEDLRSTDPEVRARGRAALLDDTEGALLLRALRAPEGIVRGAAASVLAEDPARATSTLRTALRELLRDRASDSAARGTAARALGAAKSLEAAVDLRAALRDLPREAALALAEIGDSDSLPELRKLRDAAPAEAPAELGYALTVLGDRTGEEILIARLAGGEGVGAATALHLLRRLTGKDLGPSVALWTEALRVRRLAAALADRDWERSEAAFGEAMARGAAAANDFAAILADRDAASEARGKAAEGLGLLGHEDAGPILEQASGLGQDPWVRVFAIEALGRIAWAPAAPFLARMLVNDEDTEVQKTFFDSRGPFHMVQSAAARALLAMGCDGAVGCVVDQLSKGGVGILPTANVADYRIRVYYEALATLRDYGGPAAKDGFGFLPEAPDPARAAAAARAVAWWRARPRDLAVTRRARFEDPLFAARIAKEIAILGQYKFLEMDRSRRTLILIGSPAVPHLVAAVGTRPVDDPSGQTRIGAAQVLASIGHPDGIPAVRAALARAEIAPVRCQILVALGGLGPKEGVPEALPLLASRSPDERAAAAEALGRCPTPNSAAAVAKALAAPDLDASARIHLGAALLAVREPAGMEPILGYLRDPDVVLRRRAWDAAERWVEGLGPFDPDTGTGFEQVSHAWDAQKASPRYRERTVPGR